MNVRESEDAPSISMRPRRASPGSHPLKGFPCSALRRRIGNALPATAPADGYTLLMTANGPHVIAPSLYASLPYNIFKDYAAISLVSAGTPKVVIARLNAEVVAALNNQDMKDQFTRSGSTAASSTPAAFDAVIKRDYDTWARVIKGAGIKLE